MTYRFIFKLALFQIVIALILCIIYCLDKGFDLTDESFLAMIILDPENTTPAFTYHKQLSILLTPFAPGFITFRLVRLLLTIASGIFLGDALSKWLNQHYENPFIDRFSSICLGVLAVMHGYALYPQTISYNNLSQMWLILLVAVMFKRDVAVQKNKMKLDLISGLLLFLLLTTKITSVLAFLPFWLIIIVLQEVKHGFRIQNVGRSLFWCGIGFLFFFLIHSVLVQSIFTWLFDFKELAKLSPRNFSEMMNQYVQDVRNSLNNEVLFLLVPVVLLILLELVKGRLNDLFRNVGFKVQDLMISTVYLLFLIAIIQNDYIVGGIIQYSKLHITFLGVLLMILVQWVSTRMATNEENEFSNYGLLLLLLIVPAIGSVGTDNSLVIQITQYMFSWVILVALVIQDGMNKSEYKISRVAITAVLVVILAVQIFDGAFLRPYRIKGGALAQTESVRVGHSQMKVDPENHRTILELRNLMQTKTDFDADPVISLTGMPGLSYLLDGKTVGNSWTKNGLKEANCFNWKRHSEMDLSRTVIISDDIPKIPVENIRCLQEIGIQFPDDYVKIGYVNIYVYRLRYCVFVPRKMIIS